MNKLFKLAVLLSCVFLYGLLSSCHCIKNSSVPAIKVVQQCDSICHPITKTNKQIDLLKGDFFDIESMSVEGNCLKLEISYGGGCGETELQLFYHDIDDSAIPAKVYLASKFIDNDPCRAMVRDTLHFDLSAFEGVARSGGITLFMKGFDKKANFALPLH